MVICCPAPIWTRWNSLWPLSAITVVCGVLQLPNIWFSAVVQVPVSESRLKALAIDPLRKEAPGIQVSLLSAMTVETHENWLEAPRYLNMDDLKEQKKIQLRQAA